MGPERPYVAGLSPVVKPLQVESGDGWLRRPCEHGLDAPRTPLRQRARLPAERYMRMNGAMAHHTVIHTVLSLALVTPLALAIGGCGKKGAEGIPECDTYFKAVESCGNPDEKGSLQAEANMNKDSWKQMGTEAVKAACVKRGDYVKDRCDVGPAGVAECDEYFKLMDSCKNETQQNNLKNNKENWKARPKTGLKQACSMALDSAKTFCK